MSALEEGKLLTLNDLMIRISDYKKHKPNQSIDSMGMFFETSNNIYFFDTGTGKALRIDHDLHDFLSQLLYRDCDVEELEKTANQKGLNISDILAYIEKEDLFKGTTGEQLYNDEFLKKAKREIGSNCRQLILELTGACNLRCKYCIYSSSEKGFREFNSKNMSKEIIKKSIDYLYDHGEEEVFVTFYGGEPLIKFELMKYAIEYAKERLANRKLNFGFTTNLTLMNREIAAYLAQIPNLSIVCSIDGPEDIHDTSRVYVDGGGTYKDAMEGLRILKEELDKVDDPSVSINFNAVFMVPYEKEKLYRIDENFQKLCSITQNSTYDITYPSSGTIPEELMEYATEDTSMWEWMEEEAKKCDAIEMLKHKGVMDSLTIVHDRILTEKAAPVIPMNACCVPGARRLYIDTQGDMYVCERINKSPKIGNILNGIDMETIWTKYFYEYSERSIEHCANCWSAKMCPVCYADRMTTDGIAENAHIHCEAFKEQLKRQFSLYYEMLEESPEKLKILNDVITV
ncbi:radical SAM/SPASM domain-containing protein [Anaerosacchariphilus polymeriproducens]|uniref:Radical SAM protein n=1 Tax=Anaerosacchariphilus polymeriproducens TaxID=1812858 RepID=A0A371AWA5_9FIRM|nr:radical SAM protein [Anaerosacchariphilus polymeriproducens]RDU23856.1 radical SAM protein [Anaerosacchariphilus polymeriproducens]